MRKAFRWLAPLLILTLLLSLAGCGSSKEKSIEETLAFPQPRWDMPPQDVIQALGLKPGLYHQEEEPYDPQRESPYGTCRITIEAYRVFGAKGNVYFTFCDLGSGDWLLQNVGVVYPEGTDMEKVKAAVVKTYGEPTGSKGKHDAYWNSEDSVYDFLSREYPESLALMEEADAGKTAGEPTTLAALWNRQPLNSIQWWDESEDYLRLMFQSPNVLYFRSFIGTGWDSPLQAMPEA